MAAATTRFVNSTKHFAVVTKYFCYPYINKWLCWYNKTFFSSFYLVCLMLICSSIQSYLVVNPVFGLLLWTYRVLCSRSVWCAENVSSRSNCRVWVRDCAESSVAIDTLSGRLPWACSAPYFSYPPPGAARGTFLLPIVTWSPAAVGAPPVLSAEITFLGTMSLERDTPLKGQALQR